MPSVPIHSDFFARSVHKVAPDLIGARLLFRGVGGIIVEVEAYHHTDPAAHSFRGPTPRNAAMFGPPGFAYIYQLYGVSWAINLVAASEGEPHAVLIRALEPVRGIELMARRRSRSASARDLANGPGKLTQALAITGTDYGADLCAEDLFLENTGYRPVIGRSPRINVAYAGDWARKPWRFYERGNRYVSVSPRG